MDFDKSMKKSMPIQAYKSDLEHCPKIEETDISSRDNINLTNNSIYVRNW